MKTTTYTVYKPWDSDVVLGEGMTAVEAAKEIIGYDDHVCEVRKEGKLWWLYTSLFSSSSPGGCGKIVRTLFFSAADTEEEAWEEISAKVLRYQFDDRPRPVAVPDEEYIEYRRGLDALAAAEAADVEEE
jgi:hypothetical protein